MIDLDARFSELNSLNLRTKGTWFNVYYEPVTNSGERLTCAVVAASNSTVLVERTISIDLLATLFGAQGTKASALISHTIDHLEQTIKHERDIENYSPLFEGFHTANVTRTKGASIEKIAQQGILLTSSIGSYNLQHSVHNEKIEKFTQAAFRNQLRKAIGRNSGLKFEKPIKSWTFGDDVKFDVIGRKRVFNTFYLSPNNRGGIQNAFSKLFTLKMVEDELHGNYEGHLIIARPFKEHSQMLGLAKETHNYIDTQITKLDYLTKHENIDFHVVDNANEAADIIMQAA